MSNLTPYKELFERIESYYLNDSKLSDKEKEIAERWELSFALLQQHRSKKVAVSKLISIKNANSEKLSIPQAYRDMSNAERLFTPLKKYSAEFLRLVLLESAFNDVKQAQRWANKATNQKDWSIAMDIKNKAEYRIIQVSGVNDVDAGLPDFTKIIPSQFNIDLPQEIINLFTNAAKKGAIDITDLMANHSEDVEFEQIKEKD